MIFIIPFFSGFDRFCCKSLTIFGWKLFDSFTDTPRKSTDARIFTKKTQILHARSHETYVKCLWKILQNSNKSFKRIILQLLKSIKAWVLVHFSLPFQSNEFFFHLNYCFHILIFLNSLILVFFTNKLLHAL